jgi:hypothetical protein
MKKLLNRPIVAAHRLSLLALPVLAALNLTAATFVVTNCNDSGPGSFRQAILDANANPGLDTMSFAIGSGGKTIAPTSPLPTITDPLIIDGTTQPGYAGSPLIELNGSSAAVGTVGLNVLAGASTVRGLAVNRFSGSGIVLQSGDGNWIAGNFIGTDVTGSLDYGNGDCGLAVYGSSNNHIGGTNAADRNLISGNVNDGILSSGYSSGNRVEGNIIGLNIAGTVKLRNAGHGIHCIGSTDNTIGGTTSAACNISSANSGAGIRLDDYSDRNVIMGNFLGVDVTGTKDLGNVGNGVTISHSYNNAVGGAVQGSGNLISGNNDRGIWIANGATGNTIQGNLIGTDVTGTKALGNTGRGVGIEGGASGSNLIGGSEAGARNIISANGTAANPAAGVGIESDGNRVQGNYIGTDITGTLALGNKAYGVTIRNGGANNLIGGAGFSEGNVIAFNASGGIQVLAGKGNQFSANSIFDNAGLGINLDNDAVTPNDPLDADTGPNNLQNCPVLLAATNTASGVRIIGTLNTTPNTSGVVLEFFANDVPDPSGYGEGKTFLGRITVATDGAGNAAFNQIIPAAVTPVSYLSATATAGGNTSEFSAGVVAMAEPRLTLRRLDGQRAALEWPASLTGYQVEATSIPVAATWTSNLPFLSAYMTNGLNTVVIQTTGNAQFFRLHRP